MKMRKRVWIYCHIDAPEDTHGALKGQLQQLTDYAGQMGFEVVGSSCDVGATVWGKENGLTFFYKAVMQGNADALLIIDSSRILRYPSIRAPFLAFISLCKIQVYSPLTGRISFQEY